FDQAGEGYAGLSLLAGHQTQGFTAKWLELRDALLRSVDIGLLALDTDEMTAKTFCHRACGARTEEGIEDHVARLRGGEHHAGQQRLRLLRRVNLVTVLVLEALLARADREQPVRAHLHVV